ncbi:hypothetical protein FD755_025282 [Muntiacus reevesi]|uniref:Core Histone H2A/H2B/H3 domain-containing protein n=1 Tax=Muntiacus reevesi TaxID=9886 RepID=A0A5N3UNN7_MUNRE|nr:hypothetical protein FD755_025282 [Muntiacus reevesi]
MDEPSSELSEEDLGTKETERSKTESSKMESSETQSCETESSEMESSETQSCETESSEMESSEAMFPEIEFPKIKPSKPEPSEAQPKKAKQKTTKDRCDCSCCRHCCSSNNVESFTSYFPRVLKEAMNVMNSFVMDMFEGIIEETGLFAGSNKCCTITSREIQTSERLLLTGETGKHAMSEATRAVIRYATCR